MSEAYEIVYYRGARVDRMTAQALSRMEARLGYELTIIQGSYNTGVGASAGTHDGGGAVDLAPWDWQRKVRAGRDIGFAMWYRSSAEGPWPNHIHGILIGNEKASPDAKAQVAAYKSGRNGLANNGPDTFWWRPRIIRRYRYRPDPRIGVYVHNVRVDFIDALQGRSRRANKRVKLIQRLLNKKNNANLLVDGIVGPKTIKAWADWERRIGHKKGQRVPDKHSLKRLFRWTIYYVKVSK